MTPVLLILLACCLYFAPPGLSPPTLAGYMLPPENTWWLTPYIFESRTEDFYVLVQFVPRVTYYCGENVFNQLAPPNNRVKRVAISAVLLGSLLDIRLAGAASVGASALQGPMDGEIYRRWKSPSWPCRIPYPPWQQ